MSGCRLCLDSKFVGVLKYCEVILSPCPNCTEPSSVAARSVVARGKSPSGRRGSFTAGASHAQTAKGKDA